MSALGLSFGLLMAGCAGVNSQTVALTGAAFGPAAAPAPTPMMVKPISVAAPDVGNAHVAPAAKAPAPNAPKSRAGQPPKKASAALARKAPPTLDLKSLEQRLKDTEAIGVLTKIALKNQVDDLLNQFREFYQGTLKTTLAELRRPYDRLILKVVALLQNSDPPLASAIASSREAIWGILADPKKFATI